LPWALKSTKLNFNLQNLSQSCRMMMENLFGRQEISRLIIILSLWHMRYIFSTDNKIRLFDVVPTILFETLVVNLRFCNSRNTMIPSDQRRTRTVNNLHNKLTEIIRQAYMIAFCLIRNCSHGCSDKSQQ
jgi:hypothetical protein